MKSRVAAVFLCAIIYFAPPALCADNPRVVIRTLFVGGNIVVDLYPDDAPITVDNFLNYVETGFYDYTIIHRTVTYEEKGYGIIQGGGFYPNFYYKPPTGPNIINESYNGLSNLRGTMGMARAKDPNSATSEFFINQHDNPFFDKANNPDGYGYCVFGKVLSGMDLVDFITYLPHIPDPNDAGGLAECPYYHAPSGIDYSIYVILVLSVPAGCWPKGDVNYNGIVDYADLDALLQSWLQDKDVGDIEVSGVIDFGEFAQLARDWGRTAVWYREIASDYDNSGKVDFSDFARLAGEWNARGCDLWADTNLDKTVDEKDLAQFARDWLDSIH